MNARLVPLLVFAALGVLLAVGLVISDRKEEIPSPLIGQPVPEFTLPVLGDPARQVSTGDLAGQPYLVNVWASWCVTCRIEHPVITRLAQTGALPVIGLNYRDEPADAQAWLAHFGDPYTLHLSDLDGRVGIDFGVVAAPETFLVNADNRIVFKHIGAIDWATVEREILPRLDRGGERGQ